MKNLITLVLTIFVSYFSQAQSVEKYIPNTAQVVMSLNGNNLSKKIGVKNLHKSAAFMDFAADVMFTGNKDHKIGNIGINLEKDLYFFYSYEERMSYSAFIYEIEKPKLFGKYIDEKNEQGEKIETANFNVLFYKGYNERDARDFLAWNDQFAIYVQVMNYSNYYEPEQVVEEAIESDVETTYEMEAEQADAVEAAEEVSEGELKDQSFEVTETEVSEEEIEAMRKADEAARKARIEKEVKERRDYILDYLEGIFNGTGSEKSILSNAGYTKSKVDKADARFWMNVSDVYVPRRLRYRHYYGFERNLLNILTAIPGEYFGNDISSNLFFNDNNIVWKTKVNYNETVAKLFSKVYSTQLPKNYLKYLESSNVLAITKTSFSSQKLWEAYPALYASMMNNSSDLKRYKEEIDVALDLVSIMLDEKAIGDVMTGDGVFVLRDLIKVEQEYKTYEYDENHDRKEVTKTKTELRPDFLAMIGTRNKPFVEKLLGLACKHEMMLKTDLYYYTDGNNREFPFEFYFAIKDDIAFISSNQNEIIRITEGKTKPGMAKEMVTRLYKSQSYAMLNIKELLSRFDTNNMRPKELEALTYAQNNSEHFDVVSDFDGTSSVTNFNMAIPKKSKNGAMYVWDFMNAMYDIENN